MDERMQALTDMGNTLYPVAIFNIGGIQSRHTQSQRQRDRHLREETVGISQQGNQETATGVNSDGSSRCITGIAVTHSGTL